MSNLPLKQHPTLKDFQEYVAQVVKGRGFEEETVSETFMLFLEECGEMAKAARRKLYMKIDQNSDSFCLDYELADVFNYLLIICNRFGVDLEKAYRDKEEVNKKRIWTR